MKLHVIVVSALALFPVAGLAQKWEIGATGGGSFYTSKDVTKGSSSVEASFQPGFVGGFVLGQEMGRYWGGEIRYTYERNKAKLEGSGGKALFGAQAHAIHYDFMVHFNTPANKTRPYISFGAGIKHYQGTGPETVSQPLSEFALLTVTSDTTPLVSVGVGVKIRVSTHTNVRIEMKNYITPLPSKIIAPNRGASVDGWVHNFVPMVGVSYVF